MNPSLHIVGQGLAGSMLGWACERAGIPFRMSDPGHQRAASRVGAGLISPATGRRLALTWRFDAWRDQALSLYRELETELNLGGALVRELTIERRFRDDAQREQFQRRATEADVAPWVESIDADCLRLRGALQVETGELIAALRQRWLRAGVLRETAVGFEEPLGEGERRVWCVGIEANSGISVGTPWEPSKGELVAGTMTGLDPAVVRNDGHWLLAHPGGTVRCGATFRRGQSGYDSDPVAQHKLRLAAENLGGAPLCDPHPLVGWRVTVKDRRPLAGWLDPDRRVGLLGGLAAKGALWAPVLARQWAADQLDGNQIDPAARADRFQ